MSISVISPHSSIDCMNKGNRVSPDDLESVQQNGSQVSTENRLKGLRSCFWPIIWINIILFLLILFQRTHIDFEMDEPSVEFNQRRKLNDNPQVIILSNTTLTQNVTNKTIQGYTKENTTINVENNQIANGTFQGLEIKPYGTNNETWLNSDETSKSEIDTIVVENIDTLSKILSKPFYEETITNPLDYDEIIIPAIQADSHIPYLNISCILYDPDHLNIVIRDAQKSRWEIPLEEPFPYSKNPQYLNIEDSNFDVQITSSPFNIKITRRSTNETIWQLIDRIVYTDLYIEFSFTTPTNHLYGFGERVGPLQYKPGTYSLFILDRSGQPDPGHSGFNSHGQHPMYLTREKSGLYHIFFFKNTNAQELTISNNQEIKWITIGGVLDLNFFLGDTPENAVEKYHYYVGGWTLPALWHLGHHQSKWWGYKSASDLGYVLSEYRRANLPLDAIWSDIDYFKSSINLYYDEDRFPPAVMKKLLEVHNKKWTTVVQSYLPFQNRSAVWTYPDTLSMTIKDGKKPDQPAIGGEFSG